MCSSCCRTGDGVDAVNTNSSCSGMWQLFLLQTDSSNIVEINISSELTAPPTTPSAIKDDNDEEVEEEGKEEQ